LGSVLPREVNREHKTGGHRSVRCVSIKAFCHGKLHYRPPPVIRRTLAAMTHTQPDVLEQRLEARGIVVRKDQTIHDIAGDSPRKQLQVLEVVFLP
jgi:hypothetical protein